MFISGTDYSQCLNQFLTIHLRLSLPHDIDQSLSIHLSTNLAIHSGLHHNSFVTQWFHFNCKHSLLFIQESKCIRYIECWGCYHVNGLIVEERMTGNTLWAIAARSTPQLICYSMVSFQLSAFSPVNTGKQMHYYIYWRTSLFTYKSKCAFWGINRVKNWRLAYKSNS
jgi:hypothetical protein